MVKPFKLDQLKKVSKHEVELVRALYEFLPATDVRDKFHVSIRKSMMKHLGQDIRYFLSSCDTKTFSDFTGGLPEYPALMVMGLTPIERKAIVQIDNHIANIAINKLLSGEATASEMKPLTETEQGVLQYLIMQILGQVYKAAGAESRVHFRFEKFLFDPVEVRKFASNREHVCVLTLEVTIGDQSGFVRLVFPDPFLEEMVNLIPGAGKTKKEREYFGRQLKKWGYVQTSVWAEAGNSLLSPVEIKDLEKGDVILFDRSNVKLDGKKVAGKVLLHFGPGEEGVDATLADSDSKKVKCKLGNIHK